MRLKNKVALISGAASGMGAATARLFAREGAKGVVVADVLEEDGEAVVADIKKAGGEASFMSLDVTDEAQWKATVEKTVATYGALDVLVNNAGISGSAEQDLYDTAAWHRLMGINSTGVFLGMKYGIRAMKRFFFNDTPTTEIYTLSLHDALPISALGRGLAIGMILREFLEQFWFGPDCRQRSEEHTSELQSHSDLVCRLLLE